MSDYGHIEEEAGTTEWQAGEFDWRAVEDPVSSIQEELGFGRQDSARILRWHLAKSGTDTALDYTLLRRTLSWIGSVRLQSCDQSKAKAGDPIERRIGLRAAIAIGQFLPETRTATLNDDRIAAIFGVCRSQVPRLRHHMLAELSRIQCDVSSEL